MIQGLPAAIDIAAHRLKPLVRKTPLERSSILSITDKEVYLKLECVQHTRSFKVRGAINKLLGLTTEAASRGVITASTGNHGLAVAYGLERLGIEGTIFLPETASSRKIELLERQGASLEFYGIECAETEAYAREEGRRRNQEYVSPYNDMDVIAGQGTIGVELIEQLPDIDAVFVPVGGGGLISGIGAYLKHKKNGLKVIGCLPENSPVMFDSVRAGQIVPGTVLPTLSDGTAGGLEHGAVTFDICKRIVDEWVLVTEAEIQAALKLVFDEHALVLEGAAGVAVAACQKALGEAGAKNAAVILCGSNIDMSLFRTIVA